MKTYVKMALAMMAFSFAVQATANPRCSHQTSKGILQDSNPEVKGTRPPAKPNHLKGTK